jgi:hypothetical protein
MAKPTSRKPTTPIGKTTAPGQLAKTGTGTARSYAPGQAGKTAKKGRKA